MNPHSEAYLEALPHISASIDAQECAFYFNNSLFLLSRIENSPGWSVERRAEVLLVHAGDEWSAVLPLTRDRGAYAEAVVEQLEVGKTVLRVPRWLSSQIEAAGRHEAQLMWPDYVCKTEDMQTMAGRRLKGIRQRLAKLDRGGELMLVLLDAEHQAEAGELARLWYSQRRTVLKTMYLFKENVWLFEHWAAVSKRIASAFGVGVLHGGRLVAVNLTCPLSDTYWVCHTERYDGACPVYANQLAFREACRRVDAAARPFLNDGSTEVPYQPGVDNLTTFKHRLAAFELSPYMFQKAEGGG